MSILSRHERQRLVLKLYNEGKTIREIAKEVRMSFRDIGIILNKVIKENDKEGIKQQDNNDAEENKQQEQQQLSLSAQAYKLFSDRKTSLEVAIALNLRESEATKLYKEYWNLKRLHILNSIYNETTGKLGPFLKLYRLMKEKGMSIEQVVNAVETAIHKLPYMETLYRQAKDETEKMQRTIQRLANDIEAKKDKISLLDKIAFSSEQDCKKTEQRVQELTAQKNRLEKLIANILSDDNEGYSKIKQIVKENVNAVLSENKELISVSFAAIIQTLKTDPKMVNLIYNMPTDNDGKQHEDNNNNITNYLEVNKDNILNLTERHYETLVEALTNNAIFTATASSDAILSLPQSSSTFEVI